MSSVSTASINNEERDSPLSPLSEGSTPWHTREAPGPRTIPLQPQNTNLRPRNRRCDRMTTNSSLYFDPTRALPTPALFVRPPVEARHLQEDPNVYLQEGFQRFGEERPLQGSIWAALLAVTYPLESEDAAAPPWRRMTDQLGTLPRRDGTLLFREIVRQAIQEPFNDQIEAWVTRCAIQLPLMQPLMEVRENLTIYMEQVPRITANRPFHLLIDQEGGTACVPSGESFYGREGNIVSGGPLRVAHTTRELCICSGEATYSLAEQFIFNNPYIIWTRRRGSQELSPVAPP